MPGYSPETSTFEERKGKGLITIVEELYDKVEKLESIIESLQKQLNKQRRLTRDIIDATIS